MLAGGVESMSRSPYILAKASQGFSRAQALEDTTLGWRMINPAMAARYGTASMPETAENVADAMNVSREDQYRFAERSQARAAIAQENGYFAEEITAVTVGQGKAAHNVDRDEHPRPDTRFERDLYT